MEGLQDDPNENYEQTRHKVQKFFKWKMGINPSIISGFRINSTCKDYPKKPRTVLVKLPNNVERTKGKLKGSLHDVFVNEDLLLATY